MALFEGKPSKDEIKVLDGINTSVPYSAWHFKVGDRSKVYTISYHSSGPNPPHIGLCREMTDGLFHTDWFWYLTMPHDGTYDDPNGARNCDFKADADDWCTYATDDKGPCQATNSNWDNPAGYWVDTFFSGNDGVSSAWVRCQIQLGPAVGPVKGG